MPNHPLSCYEFDHGSQMWLLDREQMKVKAETNYCKLEQAAFEGAEKINTTAVGILQ